MLCSSKIVPLEIAPRHRRPWTLVSEATVNAFKRDYVFRANLPVQNRDEVDVALPINVCIQRDGAIHIQRGHEARRVLLCQVPVLA